jgi:hypothetical protein
MITTDYKVNFTKAENDLFSWSAFEKDFLTYKPTGKQIYQMEWYEYRNSQPITDQSIIDAACAFWDELSALQKAERELKEKHATEAYAKDCEQHDAEIKNGLCPKCGTYCYGDCESN